MAAKYCICPKCNIKFDRNKIQAVKVSARRYGHASCYPDIKELVPMENSQTEDKDLKALNDYISQLYKDKANYPLIKKQIKKFHEENGYSYSGILKTLVYFYEVKHNTIEKSNGGIGIVEYCYQDAYNYYLAIFMAQQRLEKEKTFVQQVKEYIFKPKKSQGIKNKVLNWGEEDED